MNSIFSMRRFAALIKNDLLLNGKKNLLGTLAVFGGMFLFMVVTVRKPTGIWIGELRQFQYTFPEDAWVPYLLVMFLVYLLGVITNSFGWLKEKNLRSSYLQIPASSFEKFMYVIVSFLVAGVAYFLLFWLDAQLTRVYIIWRYDLSESVLVNFAPFKLSSPFTTFSGQLLGKLSLVFGVLCLICYGLLANIWFRRLGWIKLVVLLVGLAYLYVVMLVTMSHVFFPEQVTGFEVHIPGVKLFATSTIDVMEYYIVTMLGIGWLMLLAIGFFKFKETEV
jgi:hypothetical protein